MEVEAKPPSQYYACDICKSMHMTITLLLQHFESTHNEQIPICAIPINSSCNEDNAKISCKECSSKFINKKRRNSHLKSCHGYASDLAEDEDEEENSDGGSGAMTVTPSPNLKDDEDDDESEGDDHAEAFCEVCNVHLKSRLSRHLASNRHMQNLAAPKRAKISKEE